MMLSLYDSLGKELLNTIPLGDGSTLTDTTSSISVPELPEKTEKEIWKNMFMDLEFLMVFRKCF